MVSTGFTFSHQTSQAHLSLVTDNALMHLLAIIIGMEMNRTVVETTF